MTTERRLRGNMSKRYMIDYFKKNYTDGTLLCAGNKSCILVREGVILRHYTLEMGSIKDYKGD